MAISLCGLVAKYGSYVQKVYTVPNPCVQHFNLWQPPVVQYIKINFDAYVSNCEMRGLGVVLHDDRVCILFTGTKMMQATWSVELSKAMAALNWLMIARRMGY